MVGLDEMGIGARIDEVEARVKIAEAPLGNYVGTTLKGKWQVERLIGFGGMATVFAARHRNGRRVAIKFMRPELVLDPSLFERFLREGYVANKIEHPGAVAILDDDVMDDGTPFLVMELLEGMTLREHLAAGPLHLEEALRTIAETLDVLAAAHDRGIVHRDLKPDNLFLTNGRVIKVLDFGIARLRERTRAEHETQLGTTMGTVGFMPPEQARGLTDEVDARSDVWAVGATLFTLLTGQTLHKAATTNEALLLAMTTPVRPTVEAVPWLPKPVRAILERSLAFEKGDRYENARAFKVAVDAVLAGLGEVVTIGQTLVDQSGVLHTEIIGSKGTPSIVARAFSRRGRRLSSNDEATVPMKSRAFALAAGAAMALAAVGVVVAELRVGPPVRISASSPRPSVSAMSPVAEAMVAAPMSWPGDHTPASVAPVPVPVPSSAVTAAERGPRSATPPAPKPGRGLASEAAPVASARTPAAAKLAPTSEARDPLGARH